jgi:hypothetical protein
MRCPDCNRFVSFDTEVTPESTDVHIFSSSVIGEFRRVLTCESCGTELKEATIGIDTQIQTDSDECNDGEEHEWEFDDGEPEGEPTMVMVTTDAKGKPIAPRYAKTYYGVEISGTVKCSKCDATGTFNGSNSEQASAFDEVTA